MFQNHIGDKIESPEYLKALTLAICEFSLGKMRKMRSVFSSSSADICTKQIFTVNGDTFDAEKLKRHSKIAACYVKESSTFQNICLQAVEEFANEHVNIESAYAFVDDYFVRVFDGELIFCRFLVVDLREKVVAVLHKERVIVDEGLIVENLNELTLENRCVDDEAAANTTTVLAT